MTKIILNFKDDINNFDLGKSGAFVGEMNGSQVLCFKGVHCFPVLHREAIEWDNYVLKAEVACISESYVGLVFGAADSANFNLIYVSADNEWDLPNLQYDPVMNGSSTWQIYHGSNYQALVSVPPENWVTLTLKVQGSQASVYVGNAPEPNLVIPYSRFGENSQEKVGVWGTSDSYIRNLTIEQIDLNMTIAEKSVQVKQHEKGLITNWMIKKKPESIWNKVQVEENGTLNLNQYYTSEKDEVVLAQSSFYLSEGKETLLKFGFSDHLKLWVNDVEVFEGEWVWITPGTISDGRIRLDQSILPITWRSGLNIIRAEITSIEEMYGWGLILNTGLSESDVE